VEEKLSEINATLMKNSGFSWVQTHEYIVSYLRDKQNSQKGLIELLSSVEIWPLNDKDKPGDTFIPLTEIDPFSFFCYIYKYGFEKRLQKLQEIAVKIGAPFPEGTDGVPSTQPQRVWLFLYKYLRKEDDIDKLWSFFFKALNDSITDADFEDILKIKSVGKTKLTEALFDILPHKYFPINGPAKPYLEEVLNVKTSFSTYSEYMSILSAIRKKTDIPFYELSHDAWEWTKSKGECNYWLFQGNPKYFDTEKALQHDSLGTWSIKSHKDKIKKGDKVILWVGGQNPGCYALAEVASDVYEGYDEEIHKQFYTDQSKEELSQRVKITIIHNFSNNPISVELIKKHPKLQQVKIGIQGTNFTSTAEEYNAMLELAQQIGPKYWLYAPGGQADHWDEFRDLGIMGLGWEDLGDLSKYKTKDAIEAVLKKNNTEKENQQTAALNVFQFKEEMSKGDIIFVKKGRGELLGYGIVSSDYFYDADRPDFNSCRKVDWKLVGNWKTDHVMTLKTLTNITHSKKGQPKFSTYSERLFAFMKVKPGNDIAVPVHSNVVYPLNTIFYGPPGTGKTYHSIKRAAEIIENRPITSYKEALEIFHSNLQDRIEFITFHQNYSYEDFVQGLRPTAENEGQLNFEQKDGIFKQLAEKAHENLRDSESVFSKLPFDKVFSDFIQPLIDGTTEEIEVKMKKVSYSITHISKHSIYFRKASGGTAHTMSISTLRKMYEQETLGVIKGLPIYYAPLLDQLLENGKEKGHNIEKVGKKNYVLIIDEINRANVSRVFGELITLIEPDKRSHGAIPLRATLPSGDDFIVPSNLYIIGTMNTADKSIALLDIALRRRFEFEAMYPLYEINGEEVPDADVLRKLNALIIERKGYDFQIGHSYFMDDSLDLIQRMNRKVIPLLLEYFLNDEKEVKDILQLVGLKIEPNSWPIRIMG
jgi:5-methylcytosine-specific restriction protein B